MQPMDTSELLVVRYYGLTYYIHTEKCCAYEWISIIKTNEIKTHISLICTVWWHKNTKEHECL